MPAIATSSSCRPALSSWVRSSAPPIPTAIVATIRRAPRVRSTAAPETSAARSRVWTSGCRSRACRCRCARSGRGSAPGLLPVAAEEIGDAAFGREELVGCLEDGEEQAALRACPGLMAAARRTPDELAGAAFAFGTDERAFEHVGLLDLHVLVIGEVRARRHAHQGGEQSAGAVDEQRLLLDAGIARLLPRHALQIDEARRELGWNLLSGSHGLRCSPTLTIFMVFVPPDLPIGSPMVSTMMSPSFTTLCCTSTFSASRSSSSRSWPM